MSVERRFNKGGEVRAIVATDGPPLPQITGYAAVFNEEFVIYEDEDFRVVETILPNAFTQVMADDVRCLFNHNANKVLGRTTNGTLALMQDDKGLAFNNAMDSETPTGREVYQFVKRQDVTGCSFAFIVAEDEWTDGVEINGQLNFKRTIKRMKQLFDVGPVTYPAYEQTSVDARLLEQRGGTGPFAEIPEEIRKKIAAGKSAPILGLTEEQKSAYRKQTEIRTTV